MWTKRYVEWVLGHKSWVIMVCLAITAASLYSVSNGVFASSIFKLSIQHGLGNFQQINNRVVVHPARWRNLCFRGDKGLSCGFSGFDVAER